MEKLFEFWMSFYGKVHSPFKLVHGDFLDVKNRPEILESTIVFVNNFAFGPGLSSSLLQRTSFVYSCLVAEVDQHLKDIFADLTDGARIFSSKSFCALNFRITDRNLSGELQVTSVHVSVQDGTSFSWRVPWV